MSAGGSALVDLAREFIATHALLRDVVSRSRAGSLRWPDVQRLVGGDEGSLLFRLKERSHRLSRTGEGDLSRMTLFDLAVGSLFHEAMKLRENFYQLEVYAPRVAQAEGTAGPGTEALFHEFARILAASRERMAEAVDESAALLDQLRQQFRELLLERRDEGLLVRFVVEHRGAITDMLGESLEELYANGADGDGGLYAQVARSYLESGYFDEALGALDRALELGGEDAALLRDRAYAAGMSAYTQARYDEAVEHLEDWVGRGLGADDQALASLARSALESLPSLLTEPKSPDCAERAGALVERLDA